MSFQDWGLATVGAQTVWQTGNMGTKTCLVCHMDTGYDVNNPDLSQNLWTGSDGSHGLNVVVAPPSSAVQDDHGHGTAVASVMGAAANSWGVQGVSPLLTIAPCKWLDATGNGGNDKALACLTWCASLRPHVVHGSWGEYADVPGFLPLVQAMAANGTLFVFSAGNDGLNTSASPHFPSGYLNAVPGAVFSVAAVERFDLAVWPGSNWGASSVNIAAPHTVICDGLGDTFPVVSGTSIAAPFVTGVIGLAYAWLQASGVDITPTRSLASAVFKAVQGGTIDVTGSERGIGGGIVHAPTAIAVLRSAMRGTEL